jgi:hypothetical protein
MASGVGKDTNVLIFRRNPHDRYLPAWISLSNELITEVRAAWDSLDRFPKGAVALVKDGIAKETAEDDKLRKRPKETAEDDKLRKRPANGSQLKIVQSRDEAST